MKRPGCRTVEFLIVAFTLGLHSAVASVAMSGSRLGRVSRTIMGAPSTRLAFSSAWVPNASSSHRNTLAISRAPSKFVGIFSANPLRGGSSVRQMSQDASDDKSEEEKAKLKEEREARKAAKEAEQRAKKEKKEAEAAAKKAEEEAEAAALRTPVVYLSQKDAPAQMCGDYAVVQSRSETGRVFASVETLGADSGPQAGESVWIRARVAGVRAKGGSAFLVLRASDGTYATVQACAFKNKEDPEGSKTMVKFLGELTQETIVDIQGTLVAAEVRSCTQNSVEIQIERCYAVSRAPAILPFQVDEASRSDEDIKASQDTDKPMPFVYQETRLDNRWLDLRVPANKAIMKVQSGVCQLFREALLEEGFCELHTPKLVAGESEGGAEVFRTDYFGKPACLAQSPQIYKQMAISADMGRVFEIGPVFRAEKSNTRRHLCEFTGLDMEMPITDHYNEVLVVLHRMFRTIFTGLEERYGKELAVIRTQYASLPVTFTEEPCIIHWDEGMQMLKEAGCEVDEKGDLSGANELKLGELVKEKRGADFFMLDRYPVSARPFYTMPCPDDPESTNSYDLFIRGQEICSGAQRVHDPTMLRAGLKAKGMPEEPLSDYIKSFEHGVSPHGGAGIGLERVVFLYLGLDNVRKASMFPRDPSRCMP